MEKLKKLWIRPRDGARNVILVYGSGDNYRFVSFNPDVYGDPAHFLIDNLFTGKMSSGVETAIQIEQDGPYYVLDGDFRKEYEEAFPDADKMMAVYNKHKGKHSAPSTYID